MTENESHEEIVSRYLAVVKELNDIDTYLDGVADRQSDIDTRISDVEHFIEELDYYDVQLTAKQCQKLVELIKDLRQIRRGLKKEQYLNDVLDQNKAKIGYSNQRQMMIADLCRKEKALNTVYKPRLLSYNEIWNIITDVNGRGRKPKNKFETEENSNV